MNPSDTRVTLPPRRLRLYLSAAIGLALTLLAAAGLWFWLTRDDREEEGHYDWAETLLLTANSSGLPVTLFRAGGNLDEATPASNFSLEPTWLVRGDYFLRAGNSGKAFFYPVPIKSRSLTARHSSPKSARPTWDSASSQGICIDLAAGTPGGCEETALFSHARMIPVPHLRRSNASSSFIPG